MRTYMTLVSEGVDVASEAFLRWFEGSKVVDASGAPLKLYRGLNGPHVQTADMAPRDGYAAFFSTSPYVAASYANPDATFADSVGAIFPVYIRATTLHEFPVREGRYGREFDKFAFDRRAVALRPGEALVARQVYDVGPRANRNVDPESLYSYASDIYAIGKGTSVKSAVSNTAFSDRPVMTEGRDETWAEEERIVAAYRKKHGLGQFGWDSESERHRSIALANRHLYPIPVTEPDYLYHGTAKARLPQIAKDGLIPSTRSRWSRAPFIGDHSVGKVFFADTVRGAEFYASEASKTRPALLRVRRAALTGTKPDPKDDDGSYFIERRVPPEHIELWTGKLWTPIN